MATTKKAVFVNEQVKEITVAGVTGSVTIPRILTDEDFATYIEKIRQQPSMDEITGEDGDGYIPTHLQFDTRRHIVKAIDFLDVRLEDIRGEGYYPYPALIQAIADAMQDLINDAMYLPNSSSSSGNGQ